MKLRRRAWSAGPLPWTPLGELIALPRPLARLRALPLKGREGKGWGQDRRGGGEVVPSLLGRKLRPCYKATFQRRSKTVYKRHTFIRESPHSRSYRQRTRQRTNYSSGTLGDIAMPECHHCLHFPPLNRNWFCGQVRYWSLTSLNTTQVISDKLFGFITFIFALI